MAALTFRTALAQIEMALVRTLRLALLERQTVADVAALQALLVLGESGQPTVTDGQPIFVTAKGKNYQWSRSSEAVHDGDTVVRPTEVAVTKPGRWLLTTSDVATGYLKSVNYWQGETKKKEFQARILAERPSVAVVWEGSDNAPRSTIPGAIYDYPCRFSVWCIDENLRPDYEVMLGSGYEADEDHPGVIAIMGDVKAELANQNKSRTDKLGLGGGVKLVSLGSEDMEDADLAERVMVLSLGVEVIGSIENRDADSEHVAIESVYVQQQLGAANEQGERDADNYVVSGLRVLPQVGLTATPSSGSVVIDGTEVPVTPAPHSFTAYSDTYLDVDDAGSITYVSVGNDDDEPEVTTGSIRVARIVTDALGVVGYEPISATARDFGEPFKALP